MKVKPKKVSKYIEINWSKDSNNINNCPGRFFDGYKFYNVNFTVEYEHINETTIYYYFFIIFGKESVIYSYKELRGRIVLIENEFENKDQLPNKINKYKNVYVTK